MMDKEKLKKIANRLTTGDNLMETFRNNLFLYVGDSDITISDISDASGVPFSTLNSLLYGSTKDIRLSTAIKIARSLGITVDELVGAATMEDKMRESVRICRGLPDHALFLVRYFIRHQETIYGKEKKDNYISVFAPQFVSGSMPTTNVFEIVRTDGLPDNIRSKAYTGIKLPCNYYMPYYAEGEIILVAADRKALKNEQCIITSGGNIYIVRKDVIIRNGKKIEIFTSIIDDSAIIPDDKIDDRIGYVVGFLNPDHTVGVR